ncbi:hypothetical protein CSB93_5788 [Pseudomonas paraeruginosa]|uniref:Uncharacterized protein n=1 Tax=Pseudomonas paraeruginosa TaxID=2994495 RepID=A0A2R3J070_9PSED|nr:hypothetical protein CSB93_5788 [Pseudomonas paraeruginosa]AWE89760.1 hypothetical protein CSC28_4586 [Pseudomonas paraeruginosa]PTC35637.1 hypothetical protein CLJ1_4337 [Pseudomonas aeruginosa]
MGYATPVMGQAFDPQTLLLADWNRGTTRAATGLEAQAAFISRHGHAQRGA